MPPTMPRGSRVTPQVILGLLIIAFGAALTADNLGYAEVGDLLRYWPLLLVAFGLARLLRTDNNSSRVSGVLMVLIGLWLSAGNIFDVAVDFEDWWPVILIGLGGLIVFRAMRGGGESGACETQTSTDSSFSEVAIWAGKVRRVSTPSFKRADLTAIMGGIEVDFRTASTGGQEAVIDVFAWWGGIEITVPPDWAVSNQVFGFMGGVDDSSSGTQDARNRLVLRGFCVMGGVEIKT